MALAWRDTSPPVPACALPRLAETHGLATALEAFAASRAATLCVVMPPALRAQLDAFLASHPVESGGLLLGHRYTLGDGPDTPVVSLEHFVPGRVFEGTGVSLALGTEVWDEARPLLDAGLVVVGWAHSHPDLGAFFSGTDRRTQRAFFAQPWQLGLCVDPVRGEEAWFRGADSREDGVRVVRVRDDCPVRDTGAPVAGAGP